MFSTAGYFKDIPCPFYDYGLCHRPYCHYKHVKRPKSEDTSVATPSTTPISTGESSVTHQQSITESLPDQTPVVKSRSSSPVTESTTLEDIFGSESNDEDEEQISPDPIQSSLDPVNIDKTIVCPKTEDVSITATESTPETGIIEDSTTSVQPLPLDHEDTNDYNDDVEDIDDDDGTANPGEELQLLQEKFKEATTKHNVITPDNNDNDVMKKEDRYENKGMKKKRLAHNNEKVVRDPGYVTRALVMKTKTTVDEKLKEAIRDPTAVYSGKKRKSHVTESQARKGTQSRPKLPITINAKIPTKIRQQFLDSFIDEFIKMGIEPTEGYSKALDKEKGLFERCSSTMIYKNRATLELRNLRKMTEQELKERKERSDKRVRDQISPTTPIPEDVPAKRRKRDMSSSTDTIMSNEEILVTRTASKGKSVGSRSKDILVPINSVLSNTKERSPFDLPPPPLPLVQSEEEKIEQPPKTHKMIPLKFYSDKKKRRLSSEDASDSSMKSSEDSNYSKKSTSKFVKGGLSFEAALSKGGSNKNKKRKQKELNSKLREEAGLEPHILKSNVSICETQGAEPEDCPDKPSSSQEGTPIDSNTLVNLSQLRKSTSTSNDHIKKVKRVIDTKPPVPCPVPTFSILSKKGIEFNADIFYSKLQKYLLSEEQLVDNGYPRLTNDKGVVLIKRENTVEPVPVESMGSNAMRHKCCRCGQNFIIYNKGEYQSVEECTYHYSRLIKSREYGEGVISKYRCCGQRRGSPGCQVALMHVTAGTLLPIEKGYVQSLPPLAQDKGYTPQVYSLDCEMVYTTIGLQLARITVINMKRETVLESLIKPSHTVVDYNTRFSGLTGKDFVNVETSLEDLHKRLQCLIYSDTILIGHSLESDLNSIKLVHSQVVDTAIVFPHRKGLPFKRGLKELMAEQLKKFIQDNIEGGHDSREDAEACMDLMIMKVKNDLQADTRRKST